MAKKVYDADEIMKMAVGLIEPDIENADYDGDGKITSGDARTNNRISSGLSIDTPVVGNTGITNTGSGGNKNNVFAVSNAYQNQADAIYKRIQETPDFKYDFNEDAVFKTLQEQFLKDGRLAAENVAGQAAALSGGYANSYGATAAGQAYMGAIGDLYDVVPELEAAAYSRYRDKKADELQNWEILQNKADKERVYAENERAYNDSRDAYLWELALQKAQLGDYSDLRDLGVDTTGHEFDSLFNKALSLAQVGDYSGLKALGVDVSTAEKQNALDFAIAAASYGDYSFLKALGINIGIAAAPKYTNTYSGSSEGSGYSAGSGGSGSSDSSGDESKSTVSSLPAFAENQIQKTLGIGNTTDFVDEMIDKWQFVAYDSPTATKEEKEKALGWLTFFGGRLD